MEFTVDDLRKSIKENNSITLHVDLIRNVWKRNVKRSNILNLVTMDNYGPADRSIRFELYENSAEGIDPEWIINGSFLRFDDIQDEYLEMEGGPYYSLDEALEVLCKKVNAMQIVTGRNYIIEK